MARVIELLLTENVEGTGIVGDVVRVRKGYARNYLLPRAFATTPSAEKVAQLKTKREEAQKALAELRKQREGLIGKLEGHQITLVRSCNDQGILYGGVTQQDMVDLLASEKFTGIKARDVRIGATIKRVGDYDIHVKFEADLEATVKLHVKPDRELDLGDKPEAAPAPESAVPAEAAAAVDSTAPAAAPAGKGEKPAKTDKAPKGEKAPKAEKDAKAPAPEAKAEGEKPAKAKGEKPKGKEGKTEDVPAAAKPKTGWGATSEVPTGLADLLKPKRERRERR
ncbi:MAG: 50S ribosomal protein L9 [Phycisphaerae bacterium]|nr:50S ribosomal protein L9 [Phycisphaerae bacterium]